MNILAHKSKEKNKRIKNRMRNLGIVVPVQK
jgi:hypothetical protein